MTTSDWHADFLGPDFQHLNLPLGRDPEGEGEVCATLIRHRPAGVDMTGRPALVWVHGMTDYFFHDHVARHFTDEGYAFYGLDLRKCGRARRPGQRWHYSENLRHYFPDLSTALRTLIDEGHGHIVPLAHSTGGLVVPLWLDHLRRSDPESHAYIKGMILNSPWLDMMYPKLVVAGMKLVAHTVGRVKPGIAVPGGNLGTYGVSLHSSRNGEWDYDLTMKPLGGHKKYLGWLRAVLEGQEEVHSGGVDTGVPVLTLHSSTSYRGGAYSAAVDTADCVLDVDQIARWAPRLGARVTVEPIEGARHDVFLSLPHAREMALSTTERWLAQLPGQPHH